MKEKLISEIIREMLPLLDNKQLRKLKILWRHIFLIYQ